MASFIGDSWWKVVGDVPRQREGLARRIHRLPTHPRAAFCSKLVNEATADLIEVSAESLHQGRVPISVQRQARRSMSKEHELLVSAPIVIIG